MSILAKNKTTPMLYYERLDKLRFFAFIAVFWQHSFPKGLIIVDDRTTSLVKFTGGHGVHLFFVISGFLITLLACMEKEKSGTFNVKNFYLRRILRIWPLYYLLMVLGIFILPNLFNTFSFCGNPIYHFVFLNNFVLPSSCESANVDIAWSVAIEEQFYLLFPVIFYIIRNRWGLLLFFFLTFIFSVYFTFKNPSNYYFHSLGNVNYLSVGCIGGILYAQFNFKKFSDLFQKNRWLLASVGTFLLSFFLLTDFGYIIHPFIFLFIVLWAIKPIPPAISQSLLSVLGKYTYGMYFYHPMILIFVKMCFDVLGVPYLNHLGFYILTSLFGLIITIGISYISYNYFERYFLLIKGRFAGVKTRM